MNWFYLRGQKTVGPLSLKQLREEISAQRLGFFDKVCKEPEMHWEYAFECKEIHCYLSEVRLSPDQDWVVLKQDQTQVGPLSLEQIKTKILSGEISYRDFIWKEGLFQWMPILDRAEFNRGRVCQTKEKLEALSVDPLTEQNLSGQELLNNVVYQKHKVLVQGEAVPPEADGVDALATDLDLV